VVLWQRLMAKWIAGDLVVLEDQSTRLRRWRKQVGDSDEQS
jgi:predicted transcriptional regulator